MHTFHVQEFFIIIVQYMVRPTIGDFILASFLFVLSFYGETLGGRGFVTVLSTIALQVPLDRARGQLLPDTRTLIFHFEIFRGKSGEIWRSEIANLGAL